MNLYENGVIVSMSILLTYIFYGTKFNKHIEIVQ